MFCVVIVCVSSRPYARCLYLSSENVDSFSNSCELILDLERMRGWYAV